MAQLLPHALLAAWEGAAQVWVSRGLDGAVLTQGHSLPAPYSGSQLQCLPAGLTFLVCIQATFWGNPHVGLLLPSCCPAALLPSSKNLQPGALAPLRMLHLHFVFGSYLWMPACPPAPISLLAVTSICVPRS